MTSSSARSGFRFSNQELFYIEQWAAVLTGVICLGMSAWAALHQLLTYPSGPGDRARSILSWPLLIAVALLGVALTRFGFKRRAQKDADQKVVPKRPTNLKIMPKKSQAR